MIASPSPRGEWSYPRRRAFSLVLAIVAGYPAAFAHGGRSQPHPPVTATILELYSARAACSHTLRRFIPTVPISTAAFSPSTCRSKAEVGGCYWYLLSQKPSQKPVHPPHYRPSTLNSISVTYHARNRTDSQSQAWPPLPASCSPTLTVNVPNYHHTHHQCERARLTLTPPPLLSPYRNLPRTPNHQFNPSRS